MKVSARNVFEGTGTEVYAIVTREAVQELGLKPGVKATALIKASHIILGAKP